MYLSPDVLLHYVHDCYVIDFLNLFVGNAWGFIFQKVCSVNTIAVQGQ